MLALVATCVCTLTPAMTLAAAPEVCRVQGGYTKLVWGTGFAGGDTAVFAWNAPFDEERALAALAHGGASLRDRLPDEPPEDARRLAVLHTGDAGRVMAVEFGRHYTAQGFYDAEIGFDVIWVANREGTSRPWLVRSAEPWFAYPRRARPGETVRVFGRNVDAKLLALRSEEGEDPVSLAITGHGRHRLYEVSAPLPEDLAPGEYELFVHNGSGGEAGWGGPIEITVLAPNPAPQETFDAREFGAQGNGTADDTQALRQALLAAERAGGGVVRLPPGRYTITGTLWVPSGVTLRGAGAGNSIITVADDRPMRFDVPEEIARQMPGHFRSRMQQGDLGALVWMRDGSCLTDLGLIDGPGVLQPVFASHDDCQIRRCRIRATQSPQAAVMAEWGSRGFTLTDCEIEAVAGCVALMHGPHEQVHIARNTMRALKPGTANTLFIRSFIRSVIEDNVIRDGDRNFCSQLSYSSAYHSVLQGNIWENNIPRRHNAGETMYESASAYWHGQVRSAGPHEVVVAGKPFALEEDQRWGNQLRSLAGTFCLVLDGKGLGQYRRVVENTDNTLIVDRPWDVVPDSSTYLMVGLAYVETLWLDNTEEHTANWTGFWGNCFGNVIDGHVLRDGSGLYLWGYNPSMPSAVAFNELIGVRVVERGNIVLRGAPVFGNSIRYSEVTGFRYRPSLHIQPEWLREMDPSRRAAISLEGGMRQDGVPESAPVKAWNLIEGTLLYDGPRGVAVESMADPVILRRNVIRVDGETVAGTPENAMIFEE